MREKERDRPRHIKKDRQTKIQIDRQTDRQRNKGPTDRQRGSEPNMAISAKNIYLLVFLGSAAWHKLIIPIYPCK